MLEAMPGVRQPVAQPLVQIKDIYACIVATAWAVPLSGRTQLSCGPAPTDGATTGSCQPSPTKTIVFIDAVTGKLISVPGFSQGGP